MINFMRLQSKYFKGELHKTLTENKMPEAEAKQDDEKSWMCSYCRWKSECSSEHEREECGK